MRAGEIFQTARIPLIFCSPPESSLCTCQELRAYPALVALIAYDRAQAEFAMLRLYLWSQFRNWSAERLEFSAQFSTGFQ